jgi:hypothetical protein
MPIARYHKPVSYLALGRSPIARIPRYCIYGRQTDWDGEDLPLAMHIQDTEGWWLRRIVVESSFEN